MWSEMYFHFQDEVEEEFGKKFNRVRFKKGYKTFHEWVRDKMRQEVQSGGYE